MRDLYTRPPETPGPPRSLHRSSLQDLFTRPPWEISIQELPTRSPHKTSMRDLYTWPPYIPDIHTRFSDIPGPPRPLQRNSLQNLFTRPLLKISTHKLSTHKLSTRSQHRTPMRDPCTRALYKISSQGRYQRSLWEIAITGALHKISSQNLYQTRPYGRSLHKISWYLWTSWQELCERSLDMSSLQDLFTRPLKRSHLHTRPPEIPGPPRPPHRSSLQNLFTSPIWDISIQDLLIPLDLLGPFTRAPYKIFTRPLWEISSQELSTRSLHKTTMSDISIQDLLDLLGLFTGALYKISSQVSNETSLYRISWYPRTSYVSKGTPGPPRSLQRSSLQDLLTRPRCNVSLQELSTRSLHRTHMRHLYTRSPDIPGPSSSLHRSSLQDLFTRPLWEIQDLFTRPLWEISSQELSTKSVHKPQMRHPYARPPDIPQPLRSLHRNSLQDLFTRHLWKISKQELSKISWYPWTA